MLKSLLCLPLLLAAQVCSAQMPQSAQTDLYFPHLADGGPASGQWQTRFTFINPNASAATVTMWLYADSGGALALNFGSGPTSQAQFAIPSNGTIVLQSLASSPALVTGWAYAGATLPVQATVALRFNQNGAAKLEITAEPTLPSMRYGSVATPQVGIAIANVYSTVSIGAAVTVYNAAGQSVGQSPVTVPALGHSSFNLGQLFPSLPANFRGSFAITPQLSGYVFIAWAVYSDASGVISSLPDGRAGFPVSQPDQITAAFNRLVNAYQTVLPDFGPTPKLVISPENDSNAINAHASGGTIVQINLALAELISDSPSELAFVVGHELGHIYQQRTGKYLWYSDVEWDADVWGLLMSLTAGYDPYAGAGMLGKLAMATSTGGLAAQLAQTWEQMAGVDAHGSFAQRTDNLTTFIQQMCGYSTATQTYCVQYKSLLHPHFPSLSSVPLAVVFPEPQRKERR